MKLKNIPNILSIIRILLVFVFVYVFFALDKLHMALLIFLIAGATDVVDGYLARRFNWITNLGKILDPFADKLMQCTVLVSLLIKGLLPFWFVIPYFAKEVFTIVISFIVIKRRSVTVVSKWYGKTAVCLFYATVAVSIIAKDYLSMHPVLSVFIYIPAVVFSFFALISYIKHYSYLKKEEVKQGKLLENMREKG